MTKSELIEALTNYSDGTEIKDDIIIKIGVNGHTYDITGVNCVIDMDTNKGFIALSNKENEERYRENRWVKLYSAYDTESEDIANAVKSLEKLSLKKKQGKIYQLRC